MTYLRHLQPTFIGVIIHLPSTMDIPVGHPKKEKNIFQLHLFSGAENVSFREDNKFQCFGMRIFLLNSKLGQ